MQNRFGFKDVFLFALVLAVGVSVWLSIAAADRVWKRLDQLAPRLAAIEQSQARQQQSLDTKIARLVEQVGTIEQRLSDGTPPAPTGTQPPADRISPAPISARNESWARPGVPVSWQGARGHVTDPQSAQGFSDGGAITELIRAQPQNITPLIYKDVYGAWVFERVTEYLAEWNPKTLELEGVLAAAWQYAPDGTWLRVRIRDEARFSDGQPVTADDVIWTFQWMRNPQVQAERPRSVTDFIRDLTKVDNKTVEFTFDSVTFTNLPAALNTFPILAKHYYEHFTPTQYNQSTGLLLGSGPWKLPSTDPDNQWTPGTDVVLVRNDLYYGSKPAFETLRFRVVNDDLPRLTAFTNGEGELAELNSIQYARVKNREDFKRVGRGYDWYNIRGGYNFIGWNCGLRNGKPTPFADKRVRRAMTQLLDRELIAREFFEGLARPATGPFNSETDQANPEIKAWPYDLDAARRLLAEAGWTMRDTSGVLKNEQNDELSFEFTFATGSEVTEKIAKYLVDQCARVGIRCRLRRMDWSVFMSMVDNRDYDAMTMGWSPAAPESDPAQIWQSKYIENQGDNFVQWSSAEADQLIEAGRRELDRAKRMGYWHRLHSLIHDEQPYTFIVERPWLRVVSNRVGNFTPYKRGFDYEELFVRSAGVPAPSGF